VGCLIISQAEREELMTVENRTCAEEINEHWENRRNMIGDFAFAVGGVHWDCEDNEGGVCCDDLTGQETDKDYFALQYYEQHIIDTYGEEALTDPVEIINGIILDAGWVEHESEFFKGAIHREYYRIQFSWGGPSDELRIYHDRVEYRFMDWFDGASIDVTHDRAVVFLVGWFQEVINYMDED
jgi:hypothetical protein